MAPTDARARIHDLVTAVRPLDDREAEDRATILAWVASGASLFRIEKPAVPPMHLAVYFALLDDERQVMLIDHVKAGCWLLPGGHVDENEDPRRTVEREAFEELGLAVDFHPGLGDEPVFVSVTRTRGPHSHTDVTLWFALRGDRQAEIQPDPQEFRAVRWFDLDDRAGWASGDFDPEMGRFVNKLSRSLDFLAVH
jgi:8-oxo-dGTP pyrophosphatase MutT (NUDIX family)